VTDSVKRPSLLPHGVDYGRKKLYSTGPSISRQAARACGPFAVAGGRWFICDATTLGQNDTWDNDTQHNNKNVTLCITTLSLSVEVNIVQRR